MSVGIESRAARSPGQLYGLDARSAVESEYDFLLKQISQATLSQACTLAEQWDVHPHEVLISQGWLAENEYYRALAESAGVPFTAAAMPQDTTLPANASLRQCLAHGILREKKERSFVFAPGRLRPNTVRTLLGQLAPHRFSLAASRTVRDTIYHHFAPVLVRGAVGTLATRRPGLSARTPMSRWHRWTLGLAGASLLGCLLFAPSDTIRAITLLLAVLFVPVITLRAIAVVTLLRKQSTPHSIATRDADATLPVYTILAPLYREAHMLPQLLASLKQLDWPALGSNGTKEEKLAKVPTRNL